MSKSILLHQPPITCTLKKVRRSKSIRVSVHQDGHVVVTAPVYTPYYAMERFLRAQHEWLAQQLKKITPHAHALLPGGNHAHYCAHKEQARVYITSRLLELNKQYGFVYKAVSIRNQRTRWGSCSATGMLSFSYKLLFLPPHLADYIIIHELCHLQEMNHGKKFWQLVERGCPEYRICRKELKGVVG